MHSRLFVILALLTVFPLPASAAVNVVATLPWLGDLVAAVGGEHVEVSVLASPEQNPHFVDAKPSFVVKLHRADLLVFNGLGLEIGWLPPLLTNARNQAIQPGQPGYLEAAAAISRVLGQAVGTVDRTRGDVHPDGNPHFHYDPRRALEVAAAIADRLARIDPKHADAYNDNLARLRAHYGKRITAWSDAMAPYAGREIVAFHNSVEYLADWLQLQIAGFIEPLPGIPPSGKHLAQLILRMRERGTPVVLSEPWYENEIARTVADKSGALFVPLPGDIGAQAIDNYETYIDTIIQRLAAAFAAATTTNPDNLH